VEEFYSFAVSEENSANGIVRYNFLTNSSIEYDVIFDPSSYAFFIEESEILGSHLFSVDLVANISITEIPKTIDKLIPKTITRILIDFYEKRDHIPVIFFVCDRANKKQLARHRKFRLWTTCSPDFCLNYTIESLEIVLDQTEEDADRFYFGYIIQKENPHHDILLNEINSKAELLTRSLK